MSLLIILILILVLLVRWRPSPPPQEPEPEPWPEPWRSCAGAFLVPREAVRLFADQAALAEIRRKEQAEVDILSASIETEGIKQPLVLVVDALGRARLHNGQHRLLVAEDRDISHLPIIIEESDRIRTFSRPLVQSLEMIARSTTI